MVVDCVCKIGKLRRKKNVEVCGAIDARTVLVCQHRPTSPRLKRVTIVVKINVSPKRFSVPVCVRIFRCHTCTSSSSVRISADNHHQFVLTSKDNAHTITILIIEIFNYSLSLH